jgi:hypothetical protein
MNSLLVSFLRRRDTSTSGRWSTGMTGNWEPSTWRVLILVFKSVHLNRFFRDNSSSFMKVNGLKTHVTMDFVWWKNLQELGVWGWESELSDYRRFNRLTLFLDTRPLYDQSPMTHTYLYNYLQWRNFVVKYTIGKFSWFLLFFMRETSLSARPSARLPADHHL